MPALSHLVANRKAVTIPFGGGDDLHIEYFPRRLTGEMLVAYQDAKEFMRRAQEVTATVARAVERGTVPDPESLRDLPDGDRARGLLLGVTDLLLRFLASWDLTAEEGGPVLPITRENVEEMGLALEWAVLDSIMTDGSAAGEAKAPGGSPNARPSGAGSSRRGNSARARTGTPS